MNRISPLEGLAKPSQSTARPSGGVACHPIGWFEASGAGVDRAGHSVGAVNTSASLINIAVGDVVGVSGEIDAQTIGLVVEAVRRLPDGDRHLDATDVTFAGSAALGGLLHLTHECSTAGSRLTVSPSATIRRLARIASVEHALPFV